MPSYKMTNSGIHFIEEQTYSGVLARLSSSIQTLVQSVKRFKVD